MFWNSKKEEKYTLYTPTTSIDTDLLKAFGQLNTTENKIIDCSVVSFTDHLKITVSNVYNLHLEEQKSFIVVIENKEDIEELEELFVVVPTVSEAIDYIYMEELERNL